MRKRQAKNWTEQYILDIQKEREGTRDKEKRIGQRKQSEKEETTTEIKEMCQDYR